MPRGLTAPGPDGALRGLVAEASTLDAVATSGYASLMTTRGALGWVRGRLNGASASRAIAPCAAPVAGLSCVAGALLSCAGALGEADPQLDERALHDRSGAPVIATLR